MKNIWNKAVSALMALLMVTTILNLPFPASTALMSGPPLTVSGSDTSQANDTYVYQSDYNGKACYSNMGKIAGDGTIILGAGVSMIYWENGRWELHYQYTVTNYSYSTSNGNLPPTDGWVRGNGSTDSDFSLSYGPTFSFANSTATVNESAGVVNLTVQLNQTFPFFTTLSYTTTNGTAQSGSDFSGGSGSLAFNSVDALSVVLSIPIEDDTVYEPNETFTVTLTGASAGAAVGGVPCTVTIVSDDPQPTVAFASATASADEDSGTLSLPVQLSNPSSSVVSVNYATADGTAGAGSDYTTKTGTLQIAAGSTQGNIQIPLLDDNAYEADETFTVTLSGASGATLGSIAQTTVTIANDDAMPNIGFSQAQYSATEGDATVELTVQLSSVSASAASVNYATGDLTAKAGEDYTAKSGTVTIPAGSTSATITLALPAGDTLYEGEEKFTVTLTGPAGALLGADTATVKLADDDAKPVVGFQEAEKTVSEDASSVSLPVTLSGNTGCAATVQYAIVAGSATADDYTPVSGTLTFPVGVTSATVDIPLTGDALYEGEESFTVVLSNPSDATLSTDTAVVRLTDNDPMPQVAFSSTTASVSETAGSMTLAVNLSAASGKQTTVQYRTIDGSAKTGADFTAQSGTLTFLPGETSKSIVIPLTNDNLYEAAEYFTVELYTPDQASLGNAIVSITLASEDSQPAVGLANAAKSVNEGASGTLTIQLSALSGVDTTVQYASTAQTATEGTDYTALAGTVTIPAGSTSADIALDIPDDGVYEGDETFQVTLSSPVNATLSATPSTVVTILDHQTLPVVSYVADAVSADEGDSAVTLTATLSGPASSDITLNIQTQDGTATAGHDYTAAATTVVIPAGSTSKTFQVSLLDDAVYEGSETFAVRLYRAGWPAMGEDTATVTVADDEPVPSIGFDTSTVTVREDTAQALLTVRLSGLSKTDTSVQFATGDGSAADGEDYTGATGTATIPAGSLSATIAIDLLDDTVYEGEENFTVSLSAPTGATIGQDTARVVVVENEASPVLRFASTTVTAAESAPTAVLGLVLNVPASMDISVHYATGNGTALAGADYTATAGTLTIPAGNTTASITVPLRDDGIYESDESFTLSLSDPTGCQLSDSTAAVTVTDDETMPTAGFSVASVSAGESSAKAVLNVQLSGPCGSDVTLQAETVNGSAKAALDYQAVAGTVTIPAGAVSAQLEIPLYDDAIYERDETFDVKLSNPTGVLLGRSAATVTVTDDEPLPTLGMQSAAVTAQENTGSATITLELSGLSAFDVTVWYATADGTAVHGADYTEKNGTATIPAGSRTAGITIPLLDNATDGPDRQFSIKLSLPSGAALGTDQTTVTIMDEDAPPQVGFASTSAVVQESAAAVSLSVTLSAPSGKDVSVIYQTQAGTAAENEDYVPQTGTLVIPAGATTGTIQVDLKDDAVYEGTQSFGLQLSAPSNATMGQDRAMVLLLDDELTPTVSFAKNEFTVSEGDGTAMLTVQLSGKTSFDVDVRYKAQNGTAKAGSDFANGEGTLTIPAGQLSGTIRVGIVNDGVHEPTESFTVDLLSATGVTADDRNAKVTITDNDAVITAETTSTATPSPSAVATVTPTVTTTTTAAATPTATATPTADATPAASSNPTPAPTATAQVVTVPDSALRLETVPASNASATPGGASASVVATVDEQAIVAALEQAQQQGDQNGTILRLPEVRTQNASDGVALVLPASAVQTVADAGMDIAVQMNNVGFTIPSTVLRQPGNAGNSTLELHSSTVDDPVTGFTVKGGDGKQIATSFSFELILTKADGTQQKLTKFDEPMVISVQLTEAQAAGIQHPERVKMCYIDKETGKTEVMESSYDPQTRILTFTTSHFSVFTPMEIQPQASMSWLWWTLAGIVLLLAAITLLLILAARRTRWRGAATR